MRATMVLAVTGASILISGVCVAQTWGQPGAQPPPPAQPGTGLEAGGLRPPTSQPDPAPAPTGQTEQELDEADREDSGRGLEFFWIAGEAGFQYLGLHALSGSDLVDPAVVEPSSSGLVYGGGLGVRLVFITLGARFRYSPLPDWAIWTLGAEAGLRIPLGSVEPYFTFGAGYASVGAVDAGPTLQSGDVDIKGLDLRLSGGLDWYLSSAFSVGANLAGDVLFLTRPAVSGAVDSYAADASSVGAGFTATAVVGLHF